MTIWALIRASEPYNPADETMETEKSIIMTKGIANDNKKSPTTNMLDNAEERLVS